MRRQLYEYNAKNEVNNWTTVSDKFKFRTSTWVSERMMRPFRTLPVFENESIFVIRVLKN